jgi:hypothetical protein
MSDWFNLNSIVGLQRDLINDLKGNTSPEAQVAINATASNLSALSDTVNNSSVLPTLTYQDEVNAVLVRENERLADRKRAIDAAEVGQKRLIDLTTSVTQRNAALNKMYVVATIAALCYLGIRILINFGIVPEIITDILFILLVTGTIILLINMYYDYDRRNNMDYNMINLGEPAQLTGSAATGDAASRNFLELRFNGCVKDACCSEGTAFNEKYSICVPKLPPNDGVTQTGFKYFIASKSWQDIASCGEKGYSDVNLACNGNTVAGFTTISATSDYAKPNAPTELVDYNLYK